LPTLTRVIFKNIWENVNIRQQNFGTLRLMETIDTLIELGLTLNQARIYVALLQSEKSVTAKEISKITNITRQDIYRILPALHKAGLLEKTITAPTMFKATPLKLGISILIKNKTAQHNELMEKANKMSDESWLKQSILEDEPEFILIPGNEAVVQKINNSIRATQTSLDIVTSKKRLPRAMLEFFDARLNALKRGVKIQVVTERLPLTNADMEKIMLAEKKAGVVVKFMRTLPSVLLLLFDKKQVMIITSATGTLETSALWSNNPCIIALSTSYFERLWNSAIPE
jgi:sugar-specific transcriptional regulator TrmB